MIAELDRLLQGAGVFDPSGVRQAVVETAADQGDAAGETLRTFLQVNPDLTSGRWDDQAARFFRSDQC
jgi:hypothetical protein